MNLPLPLKRIHDFKYKSIKVTGQLRALAQLEIVATIAESKYQCEKGYRLYYVFDHSRCHDHGIYADDAQR